MKLAEDSTIYHYRLVQRFVLLKELVFAYIGIFVIFSIALIWSAGVIHIVSIVLGLMLIQCIHSILVYIILHFQSKVSLKGWSWRVTVLWLGLLPTGTVSIRLLTAVQAQVFGVGIVLIACLFPWVSPAFLICLLFVHCWTMLPRVIALLLALRQKEANLIKLNAKDISLYSS